VNRYKDRDPLKTIKYIKDALLNNSILTTEKWVNDIDDIYSVKIDIDGTNFFVNGKGSTKAFALASAYGELMERLQNLAYFRMKTDFLKKDNNNYNFRDEKILFNNKEYFEHSIKEWVQLIKPEQCFIQKDLISQLNLIIKPNDSTIRYYRYSEYLGDKTFWLPYEVTDIFYGTNGMVAGNSEAEAMVQGLSEILERYVTKCLLTGNITPPDINEEVIDNFSSIKQYKRTIEKSGQYKIQLKDLSLGLGIPAVGLILFNLKEKKYFVKIAVHPVLEIALERCFTELMQGKKLNNYANMREIGYSHKCAKEGSNALSIFYTGEGVYPYSLFKKNPTYENQVYINKFDTNTEMCTMLINLINNLGYTVFIKDVSFLELNSYHIIVPGMSEMLNLTDIKHIQDIHKFSVFNDILKNLDSLSKDNAKFLLNYLETYKIPDETKLISLLKNISLKKDNFYRKTNVAFFKCMLYLFLKDYGNALKYIRIHNKKISDSKNSLSNNYYKCFEHILALKTDGLDKIDSVEILRVFYPTKVINEVFEDIKENPFKYFPHFDCDNHCTNCTIYKDCLYTNEKRLYDMIVNLFYSKQNK